MKRVLVTGAGGFIGSHLVEFLKKRGYYVVGVDIKYPEFAATMADEFRLLDLRVDRNANMVLIDSGFDEVYALAADVGGMGHISTHDAEIVRNNLLINLNTLEGAMWGDAHKFFFSSSACIYNELKQMELNIPPLREEDAWPAQPDTGYGLEKLMTEKLCEYYQRDYGLRTYVARFHNVYGPQCTWCGPWNEERDEWDGGREKAPAALCRKIAVAKVKDVNEIEIWGDGEATRSFLYIDDCLEGTYALMQSDHHEPINIGSDHMVSINQLVDIIADAAGIEVVKKHVPGPQGVRGRNADLTKVKEVLGWSPKTPLETGIRRTYEWIEKQVMSWYGLI